MNKLIVISAPSGAGKTSIVHYLMKNINQLSFSISCTSRKKRHNEIDGRDYYFLSSGDFKKKIDSNEFIEWEEVYPDQFYGTLCSEVDRIFDQQKTAIFDVDVDGGINIKNKYHEKCLSIFVMPPSISILEQRLRKRGSESDKDLYNRIEKAKQEMKKQTEFDRVILNENLNDACREACVLIKEFMNV